MKTAMGIVGIERYKGENQSGTEWNIPDRDVTVKYVYLMKSPMKVVRQPYYLVYFAITGLEMESFLKDLVIMNRSVMS